MAEKNAKQSLEQTANKILGQVTKMHLNKTIPIFTAIFLLGCAQQPPLGEVPGRTTTENYHVHADFLAVLDGQAFDFNKPQYMSTPYKELSENIHLHDFNPFVIHVHSVDATLGDFFESLGMKLEKNCFDTGGQKFCSTGTKKLQLFVNGKSNEEFESHKPRDLEKIMVFFGEGAPPQELLDSISNQACIYSEKCPAPPGFAIIPENCSASQPCKLPE